LIYSPWSHLRRIWEFFLSDEYNRRYIKKRPVSSRVYN